MDPRLSAAVCAGKLAGWLSRRKGRGGTALPGLVALRVMPEAVRALGAQTGRRVLITGTNGKTTTSSILAAILQAAGMRHVHNREGSNLMRGFASTLVGLSSPTGKLPPSDVGIFETDEATMPAAVHTLPPDVIAVTNLFRDQLDRYGEVDTVRALWREALDEAPAGGWLVLNADDPLVAGLCDDWPGRKSFFALELETGGRPGAVDARWCPSCGGPINYERRYFSHIGNWRCAACGRRRPQPDFVARDIAPRLDGTSFTLEGLEDGPHTASLGLPGLYNVYNALAAIATAAALGISSDPIIAGLAHVRPGFGRQERVFFEGRRLRLLLCKNPAGTNQVLSFVASTAPPSGRRLVAMLLNDRVADGRDVSWVWDVDFEALAGTVTCCWAGGERSEDMALRLKYAGWPPPAAVERRPSALLDRILDTSSNGDDVFVLPTYTAMLDLRAELVRRGVASPFWGQE